MSIFFKIFKNAAYLVRGRHLNRFYLVRTSLNMLLRLLKPQSVVVDGNRFFLDKDDSMRLSILGVYEPLAVKYFQQSIKPGDVVLDIGAHIGYYTVMAAKRVGKKGKVYSFEPNHDNIQLLKKNLEVNKYKNVVIVKKAVAEKTKTAKFFLSKASTGMHSLIDIDENNDNSISVEAVSLDNYLGKSTKSVSMIKMDIEGGEYQALEGMTRLLKNKKLTIFIEFSPFFLKKANKSPQGFLKLLHSYGFTIFAIDEAKKELIPVKIKEFVSTCPIDRDWHINLMATKLSA